MASRLRLFDVERSGEVILSSPVRSFSFSSTYGCLVTFVKGFLARPVVGLAAVDPADDGARPRPIPEPRSPPGVGVPIEGLGALILLAAAPALGVVPGVAAETDVRGAGGPMDDLAAEVRKAGNRPVLSFFVALEDSFMLTSDATEDGRDPLAPGVALKTAESLLDAILLAGAGVLPAVPRTPSFLLSCESSVR